ncbi:M16 family metallopeptidase [Rickettsia endosymbiont of Cardiosporidium cionae]|uniref:M16 family metallopeptidase n=1 Tax=Rickettsia endosymbiont of Cardiosporidium cionae TaxID=2777155 RepID=UPI0018938693|nr:pitrilysin family protein [Rickettsia endosymbiont of Cardiosporidium cionae]KAF8818432.1 insulinase family protein [Rickettsia endosymbiont of Cardiosporidium cionae]
MSVNFVKTSKGLNLATYHMPDRKSVGICLAVNVGSSYERKEESGITHLIEHLLFKGTHNRNAQQIAENIDNIGGVFNAYTTKEQTVFYSKVLKEYTFRALNIIADIIQYSVFTKDSIVKELSVISQEILATYDNPDDLVYDNFYGIAYPNQPMGMPILGKKDGLLKIDRQMIQNYFSQYYVASNMYLSVVGDIDHDSIFDYVECEFAQVNSTLSPNKIFRNIYRGGYIYAKKDLEQTSIILGFHSSSYKYVKDLYILQILSLILGGGISSRLFRKIREELGLAYSIFSFNTAYSDSGIFSIHASCDHYQIQNLIDNTAVIVKNLHNISEQELLIAKNQIRSSISFDEENTLAKSEDITKDLSLLGKYYSYSEIMNFITSITILDVINAANNLFSSDIVCSIIGDKNTDIDISNVSFK